MTKDHDELDHLQVGEILLPPDVASVTVTHGSQHIVQVHYDVYKTVDESKEGTVATYRKKKISA